MREIQSSIVNPSEVSIDLEDVENSLRSLMWRAAGVRRQGEGMQDALESLSLWARYVLGADLGTRRGFELQNRLTVGLLVTEMALRRKESRGTHFRSDHPDRDDEHWHRHQTAHRTPDGPVAFGDEPGPRPL